MVVIRELIFRHLHSAARLHAVQVAIGEEMFTGGGRRDRRIYGMNQACWLIAAYSQFPALDHIFFDLLHHTGSEFYNAAIHVDSLLSGRRKGLLFLRVRRGRCVALADVWL